MMRSEITGERETQGWMGPERVLLHDGAEAVPVTSRDEPGMATWVDAKGAVWRTYCYCGPAAPYPPAYREWVRTDESEAWVTYEIEERGQNMVRTWRHRDFSERSAHTPVDEIWNYVRNAYAYSIEGREGELL